MDDLKDSVDVAIVGGGPAGQAAALALEGSGLTVLMLDEQSQPGGQILRQPPQQFRVADWLGGRTYARLKAQLDEVGSSGISWRGGRSVLGIRRSAQGFLVTAAKVEGGMERIACRYLLIATGCQDLAVPVPGWTLPGIMSAGAIQAFVKSQQLVPGDKVILAGTHPLMLVAAEQIASAGGKVVEVSFAQPRSAMVRALAGAPGSALAGSANLLAAAGALGRLRRLDVPVRYGRQLKAFRGEAEVEAAEYQDGIVLSCDAVGLCFGFVPQSELVRAAGAAVMKAGAAGGWAAVVDDWHQSSVPDLFVAGETTGVAGAEAARLEGAIAGLGIACAAGVLAAGKAERRAAPIRRRHRNVMRFARLLDKVADPRPYWPQMEPGTLVCRCEDVSLAELEAAMAGPASANSVKLATRCGMGLCQGRNCEPSLLRLLHDRGQPGDTGFTARFPSRPTPIADLIG